MNNIWIIAKDLLKRNLKDKMTYLRSFSLTLLFSLISVIISKRAGDIFLTSYVEGGIFITFCILNILIVFICHSYIPYELNGRKDKKLNYFIFQANFSKKQFLLGKFFGSYILTFILVYPNILLMYFLTSKVLLILPLDTSFITFLLITFFGIINVFFWVSLYFFFAVVDKNYIYNKWDSFFAALLSMIFGALIIFYGKSNALSFLPFGGNLLFIKSLFELDLDKTIFPWDVLIYFMISNLLYGFVALLLSLKIKEKQKESF